MNLLTASTLLALAAAQAAPAPKPAAAAAPAAAKPQGYAGHGLASVTPETLARFAPKPFDPVLTRRIQSLMDVRAPGMGQVSDDGKRLFFTWSVTGTPQLWRLDGPDRFPVQLTGGEERTSLVEITPDGKTLVLQRDRKGEENPGVYLMPADGGTPVAVQHVAGVQTFADTTSRDGRWLYYHANDRKPDAYAVYRYELATGRKELLVEEPGLWSVADLRDDGTLLLKKETGSLTSEWWERDPAGKLTALLGVGEAEKGEYEAAYAAQPGVLLVQTPRLGEFRRLYRLPRGGKLEPVSPELKWDVSGFSIDRSRARITYTVNEAGYTRLFALDARTYRALPVPSFKEADHVFAGAATRDGRFQAFGIVTATAPRSSYVLDWKTGKLARWVVPSSPEIDTSRFARATLESYPARDGTRIPAFVRRPARCEPAPCPVVVEFHGGPEGQSEAGFSTWAQAFVDQGFVFVQPNVRGSDGYGRTWIDADNGPKRLQIITDIEDAAHWARKAFAVDGKEPKVAIEGGSYGGYSALVGMTLFAGAYDAGVSIVGIANLVTFLENTAPYRRILRATEYGDPEKDRDALVKLSPVTYVERVKGPLLVLQGANDPRVPVGEAVQIHDAIAGRGLPVELVIYPDEGHGAGKRENQVHMLGKSLLFLKQHLQAAGASAAR
ncbi:MAG: prolyl oligopeptidase family serine peptidase [Anaeromyxobacteraceae bacterium]